MSTELFFMPANELASRIRRRELSPVEVVEAFLRRIDARNAETNAYVTVIHDEALDAARKSEEAVTSGRELGPLHGIPLAIKDLFDFKAGVTTTFGSVPFKDFVPENSSAVIELLEGAGAIVLGKTNTPEMGHKGVTDNLLFGPTSTPFDLAKNAGGSSGGSAAAVAAGLAPFAQGSDGGGSIRIPASCSGVYGFKASFGRVPSTSRPDAFLSHTPFIHAGPITRTVEDAALMLGAIAVPHPHDPFSLPEQPVDYLTATRGSIDGMRVAYSPDFDVFPVEPVVADIVGDAVRAFEVAGASVKEVRLGITRPQEELSALWLRQISVLYGAMVEGMKRDGLDLLGEHRGELTPQFVELAEGARGLGAVQYKLDDTMRTEVFDAVQGVLDRYDLLVTPTLAVPPVDNASDGNTLGPSEVNGQRVDPLIGWCLTYLINFTGHPAASIPAGFTPDGLPIGMQIIGRRFADAQVLKASAAFQRVRPWHDAYLRLERAHASRNKQGG